MDFESSTTNLRCLIVLSAVSRRGTWPRRNTTQVEIYMMHLTCEDVRKGHTVRSTQYMSPTSIIKRVKEGDSSPEYKRKTYSLYRRWITRERAPSAPQSYSSLSVHERGIPSKHEPPPIDGQGVVLRHSTTVHNKISATSHPRTFSLGSANCRAEVCLGALAEDAVGLATLGSVTRDHLAIMDRHTRAHKDGKSKCSYSRSFCSKLRHVFQHS